MSDAPSAPRRALAPATLAVVAGRPDRVPDGPLSTPVVPASTYHAGGPRGYGRFGNPTWDAFEAALGTLEGGRALAFASGMAAISAVLDTLPVGAVVVTPQHAYNETVRTLRERAAEGRLELRQVDPTDADAVAAALPGAATLWLESPTNPMIEIPDLAACAAAAHECGVRVVVDNTFATPLLQRPLDLGADVVVHSATKYLAGHSDLLLGATVVAAADDAGYAALQRRRVSGGAVPSPFDAWLALRGLRTLPLRLERGQASAAELSVRLTAHPAVTRVRYPGLPDHPQAELVGRQLRGPGAMLAVELTDGAGAADALAERCRLWVHATSLGGVESMLERRRRWPAEPDSVPAALVRLSVGVEDVEDLWADLEQALG